MMYACKITVKREAQEIKYEKKFDLDSGLLTLNELRKYVSEEDTFAINEEGDRPLYDKIVLCVYCKRLETEEETKIRIAKEEQYNENYEKFHAKYKR